MYGANRTPELVDADGTRVAYFYEGTWYPYKDQVARLKEMEEQGLIPKQKESVCDAVRGVGRALRRRFTRQ